MSCVLLATTALATVASAQEASPFNTNDCPKRAVARWCGPKAMQQGWTLKYESASSADLMDVYWRIEIWTRNREAMLCQLHGGRGGIRSNGCEGLREVLQ
jgi:hypothetical protein